MRNLLLTITGLIMMLVGVGSILGACVNIVTRNTFIDWVALGLSILLIYLGKVTWDRQY